MARAKYGFFASIIQSTSRWRGSSPALSDTGWPSGGRITAGRQDFAGELIVRLVLGDAVADPAMEGEGAEGAGRILAALHAQDVGPFVREEVAVLRHLQQRVDQLIAFLRIAVGDKLLDLGRRRQRAADVERYAANEYFIRAQIARHDAELLPLLVRVLVDERDRLELVIG